MRYRPIGKTAITVSEIGFGCWTMGGPNWSSSNGQPIGWADVNEEEVVAGPGREVVVADPRACHTNPAEELRLRARALGAALGVPGKGEARCVLLSLGQDDLVIRARLVPFLEVRLLPWL
jgi:hypothetical protein